MTLEDFDTRQQRLADDYLATKAAEEHDLCEKAQRFYKASFGSAGASAYDPRAPEIMASFARSYDEALRELVDAVHESQFAPGSSRPVARLQQALARAEAVLND